MMKYFIMILLMAGCAPAARRVPIFVNPMGLTVGEQQQATAFVVSSIANERKLLDGYKIMVEPYPLHFDPPLVTGFGRTTQATSLTDFDARVMIVTWQRHGTNIDVEDIQYELANVRCLCESALR